MPRPRIVALGHGTARFIQSLAHGTVEDALAGICEAEGSNNQPNHAGRRGPARDLSDARGLDLIDDAAVLARLPLDDAEVLERLHR